eukprot:gene25587-30898_t
MRGNSGNSGLRLQGVSTNIQGQLDERMKTTTNFQERIGDVLFNTMLVRDLAVLDDDVTAVSHGDILQLSALLNNPTFTGTVSGVSKAMVGLPSVDNTADMAKPISTATQTALDLKATTSALSTVSADLAALQADHDAHVSTDAVTIVGTQTITGTKSFNIINATKLNIPFDNIVPQFNPVTLVVGTVFSNNTDTIVNQNHELQHVCCSMQRLQTINSDKGIILYPGYSCTLYKDTSYGGGIASAENNSERVAYIRINRLNSFQIARFTSSNTWANVAAVNAVSSYGQNGTKSVKLFYGSLNAGNAVEIISDLFS